MEDKIILSIEQLTHQINNNPLTTKQRDEILEAIESLEIKLKELQCLDTT